MRTRVETGHALYEQHVGFALWPRRTTYDGWIWFRHYWLVAKHWGWGFVDEWRFASEADADAFFDQHVNIDKTLSA